MKKNTALSPKQLTTWNSIIFFYKKGPVCFRSVYYPSAITRRYPHYSVLNLLFSQSNVQNGAGLAFLLRRTDSLRNKRPSKMSPKKRTRLPAASAFVLGALKSPSASECSTPWNHSQRACCRKRYRTAPLWANANQPPDKCGGRPTPFHAPSH